jgi:hypothetical protein
MCSGNKKPRKKGRRGDEKELYIWNYRDERKKTSARKRKKIIK